MQLRKVCLKVCLSCDSKLQDQLLLALSFSMVAKSSNEKTSESIKKCGSAGQSSEIIATDFESKQ